MQTNNIIFESPNYWHYLLIQHYLKRNVTVSVIEPFHAFHHSRTKVRFYPNPLPKGIDKLIQNGRLQVLRAAQFDPADLYMSACELAVEAVEEAFLRYEKQHSSIIGFVTEVLGSKQSEYIFKRQVCEKLAEFYSANILFSKLNDMIGCGRSKLYSSINLTDYFSALKILSLSGQVIYKHDNLLFPFSFINIKQINNYRNQIKSVLRLLLQTFASMVFPNKKNNVKTKKRYTYGITIVGPRQLRRNSRGPDFLLDYNRIHPKEVVYIPLFALTERQRTLLNKVPGDVYYPPTVGRYFSNSKEWLALTFIVIRKYLLTHYQVVDTACAALFYFFLWKKVTNEIKFKHLVTHSDSGITHIVRNIALNQENTSTWLFTDSSNNTNNFNKNKELQYARHPFRTYLYYDHLVTWSENMKEYYTAHPGKLKNVHVVGCLWSQLITKNNVNNDSQLSANLLENKDDRMTIVVFDTTFSNNSFTSYQEGIQYASHLLQLLDENQEIYIVFKEKKDRNIHKLLDSVYGPKLIEIYNMLNENPRVEFRSNEVSADVLISFADLIISFPFTSTTFEALGVKKPAIWHDPLGLYKDTTYARIGGITTHSYNELRAFIEQHKNNEMKQDVLKNLVNSKVVDTFMDGKAIDRFKDLLIQLK